MEHLIVIGLFAFISSIYFFTVIGAFVYVVCDLCTVQRVVMSCSSLCPTCVYHCVTYMYMLAYTSSFLAL